MTSRMTSGPRECAVACQEGCAADSRTQGGDAAQRRGSHPTACWCRPRSLGRGSDEGEGKNSPWGEKMLGQQRAYQKVLNKNGQPLG